VLAPDPLHIVSVTASLHAYREVLSLGMARPTARPTRTVFCRYGGWCRRTGYPYPVEF